MRNAPPAWNEAPRQRRDGRATAKTKNGAPGRHAATPGATAGGLAGAPAPIRNFPGNRPTRGRGKT
eukprot:4962554-Lingulodinium_polyedra.AAC.1